MSLELEDAFPAPSGINTTSENPSAPSEAMLALLNFLDLAHPRLKASLYNEGDQHGDEQLLRLCTALPNIMERIFGKEKIMEASSSSSGMNTSSKCVLDGGWMNRNLTINWGDACLQALGEMPMLTSSPSKTAKNHFNHMVSVPQKFVPSKDALASVLSISSDVLLDRYQRQLSYETETHQQVDDVNLSSVNQRRNDQTMRKKILTLIDACIIGEDQLGEATTFTFHLKSLPDSTKQQVLLHYQNLKGSGTDSSFHYHRSSSIRSSATWVTNSGSSWQGVNERNDLTQGVERENANILFKSLLKVPLAKQKGLQPQMQTETHQNKQLSKSPSYAASPTSYAASIASLNANRSDLSSSHQDSYYLNLSMFELYILQFIRFPIHRSISQSTYGNYVYLHLFRTYVKSFAPQGANDTSISRRGELFFRMMIEIWVDSFNEYRVMKEPALDNLLTLATVYENTQLLNSNFMNLPHIVQQCLGELVNYLCCDISLQHRVESPQKFPQRTCLTPALSLLQQSLFKFIRLSFRFATIHSNSSSFQTAYNMWLILLEPWNKISANSGRVHNAARMLVQHKYNTHSPFSRMPPLHPNSPSRFSEKWTPYIEANFYFYTTMLSLFLRRSRELDFSSRSFDRSINLVKRVTRIFSPEVVSIISKISDSPDSFTATRLHKKNLGDCCPLGSHHLGGCADDARLLLEEVYIQQMKEVKQQNVLEKAEDWLNFIFSSGGSKARLKDIERLAKILSRVVGQKLEPTTSFNTEADSSKNDCFLSFLPERDEAMGIFLTEKGSEDLLHGPNQCAPMAILAIGDPLTNPVIGTYEIRILVRLAVIVSQWLNSRIGLDTLHNCTGKELDTYIDGSDEAFHELIRNARDLEATRKTWFRFNLRIFADFRAIVMIFGAIILRTII